MKNPLVSVVIPVFNSQDTIEETIQSVQSQTYSNWEAICVDDGSNDNSVQLISQMAEKDNRIQLLVRTEEPKGGSTCRNKGAFAANGEYLIFLDADDLLSPTCIENRITAIDQSDALFAVFPMASFYNNDISTAKVTSKLSVKDYACYFATAMSPWQITSLIIRTEYFKLLQGFDIRYPRLQDIEFHLRAIVSSKGNYRVYKDSSADCYYRKYLDTSVRDSKRLRGLTSYNLYVQLLKDLSQNNAFTNKRMFSIALLSLYCHVSYCSDNLKIHGVKFKYINPMKTNGLYNEMRWYHRICVYVLDLIYWPQLHLLSCRSIDHFLRKRQDLSIVR